MKNLYLITSIILTELIILVVLEKKEYQFFPNLPAVSILYINLDNNLQFILKFKI